MPVREKAINARKVYVSLLVADLEEARTWYAKLLGRGPDNQPMDWMIQWELFDDFGLALATGDSVSAHGAIFIYVENLDDERARLTELGINLGENIAGDYSTLAQVRDPDGNLITLASSPNRPFTTA